MVADEIGRTVPADCASKMMVMEFKFHRVTAFEIVAPHVLQVWFEDKTSQQIDFAPVLYGEMFRPLRDLKLFEQVSIDPEVHTLVWPNGADFNPDMLHDWNKHAEEIHRSAAKFETVSV